LALTLPFDIRDIEIDNQQGVKTLATRFSISMVKRLSFVCLLLSFILQYQYLTFSIQNIFITTSIGLIFILLLAKTWPNQKDHYFLLGFDGLILFKLLYLVSL
jgi:4-hydroxybenzoate polyprenyltransferase